MSVSNSQSGTSSEAGHLPGRYEYAVEPTPGGVPTDPEMQRFSDVVRSFEMDPGASLARQDSIATADAVDHLRGQEEPSATISYDAQKFPVDADGNPVAAEAYGLLRDEYNQLLGTLLCVGRREYAGGNDGAGVREYSVVRGGAVDSVSAELDPSSEQPILLDLSLTARKARSYKIHQPADSVTPEIVSTDDSDTMEITIESEDASTSETIALDGTTAVTMTTSFSDIDAVWLADNPTGDIRITDGNGTLLVESTDEGASTEGIAGGLTYSDDDQPVDGDRGIPTIGSGSHAGEIGTTFEHFTGDRYERGGSAVRPRINSTSWTVENNINTSALHQTRAPAVDAGNRAVTVDADAAGEFVSHKSMMQSLQAHQADIEHELSGGMFRFKNATPTDSASRTVEAEQATASISETFSCSGDPAIVLEATN